MRRPGPGQRDVGLLHGEAADKHVLDDLPDLARHQARRLACDGQGRRLEEESEALDYGGMLVEGGPLCDALRDSISVRLRCGEPT